MIRRISLVLFAVLAMVAVTNGASATTYDFSAFQTAFSNLKDDWLAELVLLIPVALAVWGAKIGLTALVGFGARLFRKG